jgi:hypothetical protein
MTISCTFVTRKIPSAVRGGVVNTPSHPTAGHPYYYNNFTGESTYDPPPEPEVEEDPWQEYTTEDGE